MDVTKFLGQKDVDRLPGDILRKIKKHFNNQNEQYVQLKELYDDADDNLDKLRKHLENLKGRNKAINAELSRISKEKDDFRKMLDEKDSDISRLTIEKEKLKKIVEDKDSRIKILESEKQVTDLAAAKRSPDSDEVANDRSRDCHEKPNESVEEHLIQDKTTVNRLQESVDSLKKELQVAFTVKDNAISSLREMNVIMEGLNNEITKLRSELNAANELLSKKDDIDSEEVLEKLFPKAAAANRLLKDNLSLTDILEKYYSALDQVQLFDEECLELKTKLAQLTSQQQEKLSEFENQKNENESLLKINEDLYQKNTNSILAQDCLQKKFDETTSKLEFVEQENSRLKNELKEISMQLINMLSKIKTYSGPPTNQEQVNSVDMSTNNLETASTIIASENPSHQTNSLTSDAMFPPENTSAQSLEVVDQNQSTKDISRKRPHGIEESSGVQYSADEDARKCDMMMLNRAKLALKTFQQKEQPLLDQQKQSSSNQQNGGKSNGDKVTNEKVNMNLRSRSNTTYYQNEKRSRLTVLNVSSDQQQQVSSERDQMTSNFNNTPTEQNLNVQSNLLHHQMLSNHSNVPDSDITVNEYGLQHADKHQTYTDSGCCVRICNLNVNTRYNAIRYFFNGLEIPKNAIKLLYDANGIRKNEAVVGFTTPQIASHALEWNGKSVDGYLIKVSPISDREFDNEVDLLQPPAHINTVGNRHGHGRDGNRNHNNIIIADSNKGKINVDNYRQDPVRRNNEKCIVSLSNVPAEATPEDVEHFFGKYNLTRNDISRKVYPDGSLSPYVKVRFLTPMHALEAIKRYQGKRMRNNVIHLHLIP